MIKLVQNNETSTLIISRSFYYYNIEYHSSFLSKQAKLEFSKFSVVYRHHKSWNSQIFPEIIRMNILSKPYLYFIFFFFVNTSRRYVLFYTGCVPNFTIKFLIKVSIWNLLSILMRVKFFVSCFVIVICGHNICILVQQSIYDFLQYNFSLCCAWCWIFGWKFERVRFSNYFQSRAIL